MDKTKGNKLIIIIAIALVLAVFAVVFLAVEMHDFLVWNYVETDSVGIVYKRFGYASVVLFEWDGNPENMSFTVPDEFEGHQITAFGGNYGQHRPFHIDISNNNVSMRCDKGFLDSYQLDKDHTYDEYVFVINLGTNISEIKNIDKNLYGARETTDDNGNDIYEMEYKISYYFNVAPENETFYSKDGKVYRRDNGMEVTELEFIWE